MNKNILYTILFLFFITISGTGCKGIDESLSVNKSKFEYLAPNYQQVQLNCSTDTLHFCLNDTTYNRSESINYFVDNGKGFLSFFDELSASLNIYRLDSCHIIARLSLRKFLHKRDPDGSKAYIINFDSILVSDRTALHLFDSSGHRKKTIPFLSGERSLFKTMLESSRPPVIVNNKVYTIVKPSGTINSTEQAKSWKSVYEFDFTNNKATLHYHLPELYQMNVYSFQYLYSSYCYNNQQRFVFSFAADTNIYETDLTGYHIAYLAKSRYQDGNAGWLPKNLKGKFEGSKSYFTHHAYGAIYFDAHKHRYLRVSKQRISEADYASKNTKRKQSLIIIGEKLGIIGESSIDENIDLSELFFTQEGLIYARVNRKDENALHFVRLQYSEKNEPGSLAKQNFNN